MKGVFREYQKQLLPILTLSSKELGFTLEIKMNIRVKNIYRPVGIYIVYMSEKSPWSYLKGVLRGYQEQFLPILTLFSKELGLEFSFERDASDPPGNCHISE